MRQHFQTEQWFPFSRSVVFAFFADPRNLPPLMPAWQQARIDEVTLQPPPPRPAGLPRGSAADTIAAGDGTTLLITARAGPGLPVRLPWLALIQDFHWDDHFCDLQVKGPFAYWRHCHSVREETQHGRPGTVVRDDVTYELPFSPWSRPAAPVGAAAMRAMFAFRQKQALQLVPRFVAAHGTQTTATDPS